MRQEDYENALAACMTDAQRDELNAMKAQFDEELTARDEELRRLKDSRKRLCGEALDLARQGIVNRKLIETTLNIIEEKE